MVLLICLLVANLCLLFWGLLFDLLYYWLIQYWVLCCLMITFVRCCGLTLGLRVVDVVCMLFSVDLVVWWFVL